MQLLCILLLVSGAGLMFYSIIKYKKILTEMKFGHHRQKPFGNWIYISSMVMMLFFLIGYVMTAVHYGLGSQISSQDMLIGLIFFFGALFVLTMVSVVGRMFATLSNDRSETEAELMTMSAIVDSSPQCIAYIGDGGRLEYFNQGAVKITGYSKEELMEKGIYPLFEPEFGQKIREVYKPEVITGQENSFEVPFICKDGQKRTLLVSCFTTGFNGHGLGLIATDITEMRKLEQELVKAKEQAEQASQAKSEFLSRMSHEMRTPLNAIIGMTSIGKTSADLERKDYCLNKIDSASTHLLGVINDVLDMAKIEAGKFELAPMDFSMEKMLIKVTNVISFRVEEKKQNFTVHIDPEVPYAIIADEQRLSQIITNLLSNAVKFTPEQGSVSLMVHKLGEKGGACHLQFEVKDTGIGIAKEQQRKLFRSFEQADGSVSRQFGGTGLGLAISKHIVELMDGEIWLESDIGKGTRFFFNIWAKRGQTMLQTYEGFDFLWKNLRIMLVDDAEDVREYFQNLAAGLKLNCQTAASGSEAWELIENNGPFDVIFVDWKMPGMDGIELTKRIKSRQAGHAVVVMISAAEWSNIEMEAKQAGVDKFIPKPLFASVIADCIQECLNLPRPDAAGENSVPNETGLFIGKNILLAEDIEINREIVMVMLEPTGIQIDCAGDGLEAFQMIAENSSAYDMVFMDIHMPGVDGYESAKMIRALEDPRAKAIPIVAMTANVFREDIEKCLAVGMNDHVGKPLDMDVLIAKLKQYLYPVDGQ